MVSFESAFLGDLKITSSVFSTSSQILFTLNLLFNCLSYHGWLAYLDFSLTYLYEKDLYHQENDTLYSGELPYEYH